MTIRYIFVIDMCALRLPLPGTNQRGCINKMCSQTLFNCIVYITYYIEKQSARPYVMLGTKPHLVEYVPQMFTSNGDTSG